MQKVKKYILTLGSAVECVDSAVKALINLLHSAIATRDHRDQPPLKKLC